MHPLLFLIPTYIFWGNRAGSISFFLVEFFRCPVRSLVKQAMQCSYKTRSTRFSATLQPEGLHATLPFLDLPCGATEKKRLLDWIMANDEQKDTGNRTLTLRFRASVEEKKQLTAAARQAGKTLSNYVRAQALGQPLIRIEAPRADLLTGEQRRVLIGVATNLNQAMHLSNAGQYATGQLVEIINHIKASLE